MPEDKGALFWRRFAAWFQLMAFALGAISFLLKIKLGWGLGTWLVRLGPVVLFSAAWAAFAAVSGMDILGSDEAGDRKDDPPATEPPLPAATPEPGDLTPSAAEPAELRAAVPTTVAPAEPKARCSKCGKTILLVTADRTRGRCMPCAGRRRKAR